MGHLEEFQIIANKYGNRAVLGGYDASMDYVRKALAKTGCQVREQICVCRLEYSKLCLRHHFWLYRAALGWSLKCEVG